jgi:vesicle-fusing ATPase
VGDNIVNQLLAKIDGVDCLNNVLLIAMTNRIDLLDPAVLREGRFEVHIEIALPTEEGRREIFVIHTKQLRESKMLEADVNLDELAALSKNFTGANIQGVVKSALSNAMNRRVDMTKLTSIGNTDVKNFTVTREDFLAAFKDVKPVFGFSEDDLSAHVVGEIVPYGQRWDRLTSELLQKIEAVKQPYAKNRLSTILLSGDDGSGKTALAVHLAKKSGIPFIRMLAAVKMQNYTDIGKVSQIAKLFDEAYKSPLSMLIIDDVDQLVEYYDDGPRFSTSLTSSLRTRLNTLPPVGHKLLVVCTTSRMDVLKRLGIARTVGSVVEVPMLNAEEGLSFLKGSKVTFADEAAVRAALPAHIGIKHLHAAIDEAVQLAHGTGASEDQLTITAESLRQSLAMRRHDE